MYKIIKNALNIYKNNLKKICILGLTVVIPIQLIFTIFTNYMALPFSVFGLSLWETYTQLFFTIITFFLIQLPFVNLFHLDNSNDDFKLSQIYGNSLSVGFMVYVLSILSAVLILFGMMLFVLPGAILLIILLAIPQATVLENLKWWKSVKRSVKFGKDNFWSLLILFIIFMIFDILISYISYFLAIFTSNLIIVINAFLMIGNALILPIFIFALCNIYNNWLDNSLEVNKNGTKPVGDFSRKPIY